jgi:branched-chain amino acid transport system substrate-binding protein
LAAVLVLTMGAAALGAESEIRLGVVAPVTGQIAITGQYMRNGVELAVKEFAPDGVSVGGKKLPVRIIVEDNENKPETTANAFRKLIDQDEVCAIVGPDASTVSLAGTPIAQAAGIPVVTTFPTNPRVTQVGDYIFRACFIDPFQGYIMAKYTWETLGKKKAAILYNNGNDYSKGLTEFYTESFEKFGGKVVAVEAYGGGDIRDFNAQLNNIKGTDAEILFMPNSFHEAGLAMNQARKAGITIPFLGSDTWDTPDIVQIASGAEEGSIYDCAFSAESTVPEAAAFTKAYQDAYKQLPNSNAVLAYEATAIILKAIEKAGSLDGAAIRDAIRQTELKLPSGVIKFDENRNPTKGAVLLQFTGGVARYLTTVNP